MASARSADGRFTVFFVCTGNICRSPLAERLARAYLDDALGHDACLVRVHSAGVQAVAGSGVHPDSALVLTGLGGDPSGFRARQMDDRMATKADLTLTMTRKHRDLVLQAAPRALSRTFTLREAADLAAQVGKGEEVTDRGFADRARHLVKRWATARSLRAGSAADDVQDPIGRPIKVHQQVGDVIAEALVPLLSRLVELHGLGGATGLPEPADRSPAALQ